ncbi:hypothetical protein [Paractinoplanes durhamensis]|uniref:Ricin B lectin domain-containing protein n=1 Tax=Paractinoplanes durhamensis TaxID=113563 RepID=A0ABQ3YWQ5_9ACTN|nr:hypothetical protein [Actinoplanes durhamensis]GIE01971.1 hypothetical protein Adu01nite_33210 [Actinoplanes durhamensis]
MSDDPINPGLQAYADQVQRTAQLAPAEEIRRRGDRRRRNRAAGAAFAAVLIAAVGAGALLDRRPQRSVTPVGPSPSVSLPSSTPSTLPSYKPSTSTRSKVTQLRSIGVDLQVGVLIDVADDGVDRWMQAGPDNVVDFTGSTKDDTTEMSLQPAPVTGENRVLIIPVAQPGMCVTDTPQEPLALQPCKDGTEAQVWRVVPAGDSGQVELEGRYGILKVDQKLIGTDQTGWTGMQTIKF